MPTYKIVARTNAYIAQRDSMFNGNTEVVLENNLSLSQARKSLLDMYNDRFSDERPYASNWGMAVIQSAKHIDGATATNSDGTRSFEYDGRVFSIEEETEY